MRKHYRSLLAVCTVIASLLSGCAGGHTHQASGTWEVDLNGHWQTCSDCGSRVNAGKHTLDESEVCTVCDAQIVDWGDAKSVYLFNENGDPLKLADYDADGTVITETIYQYEYDENGDLIYACAMTNGVLADECTYATVNGECVIREYIDYLEDGSKTVSSYDENGNAVQSVLYDPEGNVDMQTESEYAQSSSGGWYEKVCITTQSDGYRYVSEFSETGEQTGSARYDAQGILLYQDTWVYTYNADGNWQDMKYYHNDVLTSETVYSYAMTSDGFMIYPAIVTEYGEDGTKTITVYNANDEIEDQTRFDADGNMIPSAPEFMNDVGKTLSQLKLEYPESELIVNLGGFPDHAAVCYGDSEAEYLHYFFGTQSGDAEKAMNEYEDQLKCSGFVTTASILFPDMEDEMSFEDFFSLIDVDEYEYLGEDTTAAGWLMFMYHGMEVMVNTNEHRAGGGWDFTGAAIVKANAPASINDREISDANMTLADTVMFS